MLCVPPPRAGAQQPGENRSCSCLEHCPGAAPSLSIPSAERAWKNFPGDPGLLSRKGISAIGTRKKVNYWSAKTVEGLFLSLKDKRCFYIPDPYFHVFKPPSCGSMPVSQPQAAHVVPMLGWCRAGSHPNCGNTVMPLGSVILVSNNRRATLEHLISILWAWRFMGFTLALELFLYLTSTCWRCFCPWSPEQQHWEVWKFGAHMSREQSWAQPSPDGFSGPARGAAGSPQH